MQPQQIWSENWRLCPFGEGSCVPIYHKVSAAEAYLHDKFHLDPFNSLVTVHQRHRQTDRTDNGPTA